MSPATDEIPAVEEIEDRYPSEWVLIEDPEVDGQLDVIWGKEAGTAVTGMRSIAR